MHRLLGALVALLVLLTACTASGSAAGQPDVTLPADEVVRPVASQRTPSHEGCPTAESDHVVRLAGADRFATAACVSRDGHPDGAEVAVVARGDDAGGFADALAGTVLAHAVSGPVLLTDPDRLPDATRTELQRLEVGEVLLLGGEDAVDADVEQTIEDELGIPVDRVAGANRAATAAQIAERADATGTAFVVNGHRPADALVAGAVAARAGAKLLLTGEDTVPPVTRRALDGVDRVFVVGGFGVVGASAEERLREIAGPGSLRRVAGGDRFETAASVTRVFATDGDVYLANGSDEHLVDAIAAGWRAALPGGGPVLYSGHSTPSRGTDRYLRLGGLDEAPPTRLIGGTASLGEALVDRLEERYDEAAAGGRPPQRRAFWAHLFDDSLKSREGIADVLDAAAGANLNTVIVQPARRHDSYYTSDVLPRTTDPDLQSGLDVLAELVPAAHARGLEVQAWYSLMTAYHGAYDDIGLPTGHIYREHGPGAGGEPWMTRHHNGTESTTFLDPGHPGVRDHVVEMLTEVVERYDVDGVHLDYLRYPDPVWGYNPEALRRFRAEHGHGSDYRPSPDDQQFSNWRRQQTQSLAQRIHDAVEAIDPGVDVTGALIAQGDGPEATDTGDWTGTKAYREKLQDWFAWLQTGALDEGYPMVYFRERRADQRAQFDQWVRFVRDLHANGYPVAVGQASFLNSVEQSQDQLGEALPVSDGAVLFSYQQDTACPEPSQSCENQGLPVEPQGSLLADLARTRFAEPAPAP